MAASPIFRHFTTFTFILLFFEIKSISADANLSFYFTEFDKNSSFNSKFALFGDAELVNGSSSFSSVQLTRPVSFSAGRLMYKKPINLVEGKSENLLYFSTFFTFSMLPENGNLAFVMVPIGVSFKLFDNSSLGFPPGLKNSKIKGFAVEFDTYKDPKFGDLNGTILSVKVTNVSANNLVLNNGRRMQCWIDYDANSKHLEVRLNKLHDKRSVDPILTYPIDLSKNWKVNELYIGLTSLNRNSTEPCIIHSWSLKLRHNLHEMHSQPLNPDEFVTKIQPLIVEKRDLCAFRVVTALIFGTGCGALGAFMVLLVWIIFGKNRAVKPDDIASVHPVEFEFDKNKDVLDKTVKDEN